jgi:hypothetical protein
MRSTSSSLPPRSFALLLLAIFLTFLPTGLLLDVYSLGANPPIHLIFLTAFCGSIAVGYFYSIRKKRLLLPLVILGHIAVATIFNRFPYWTSGQLSGHALRIRLTVDVIATGLFISLGYVCFMKLFKREGARYFRAHAEIELAHGIHQFLVPRIETQIGRFAFCGVSVPSGEVGGDLVDLVELDGRWIGYVADVAGHGVASGVFMGMVKSAARMKLLTPTTVVGLLDGLNDALVPLREPGMFVTMACLRYDGTSNLEFALAGHPAILQYHAATGTIEEHFTSHFGVAMFEGSRFSSASAHCEQGDLFVLLTDGFTEVFDTEEHELGLDPLKETICRGAHLPLAALLDMLLARARAHGIQTDDQTALLIRCS